MLKDGKSTSVFNFFLYLCKQKSNEMKRASLIAVGIMMLLSCENGSISKRLTEVDSLVIKEEYDSAYQMISSIDETTIKNQEDQAHYNLLKVQTGYLANKPAASPDSLLDEVIDYYQKEGNAEKLADAFYYKAIGFGMRKMYQQAIQYYKKAEKFAEQSGGLYQQYKIAEGICFVNRQSRAVLSGHTRDFDYWFDRLLCCSGTLYVAHMSKRIEMVFYRCHDIWVHLYFCVSAFG